MCGCRLHKIVYAPGVSKRFTTVAFCGMRPRFQPSPSGVKTLCLRGSVFVKSTDPPAATTTMFGTNIMSWLSSVADAGVPASLGPSSR